MTWSRSRTRGLATLLAAVALGACAADSPEPTGTVGTWTLTAPLLEPRGGHSMTLCRTDASWWPGASRTWASAS